MRSVLAFSLLLGALGCAGGEMYGARAPLGHGGVEIASERAQPQLLSAHLARADEGQPSELLLVFSAEVDPATLTPDAFVVVRESGALAVPERALLDPADEYDENRSVTLVGELGAPSKDPPASVRVLGNVYAEDGGVLAGLDAQVRAYDTPDELVWLEILRPDEHRCPGARQVVRTYWSDNLRGVDPEDLERVLVSFSDGSEVSPLGFDDQAALGSEGGDEDDDNVLDLCLGRDAPVSAVAVPGELFRDAAGHPSAASARGPSPS